MRQATIRLYAVKGDTWDGASFTITKNGSALDLSGATIEMNLSDMNGNLIDTLSTTDGDISITDTNEFSILPFIVSYTQDKLKFDIRFIFADSSIKTYIKGLFCLMEDI